MQQAKLPSDSAHIVRPMRAARCADYSMLTAGDADSLKTLLVAFNRTVPVARARTKAYFGFDGVWWPEYTSLVRRCLRLCLCRRHRCCRRRRGFVVLIVAALPWPPPPSSSSSSLSIIVVVVIGCGFSFQRPRRQLPPCGTIALLRRPSPPLVVLRHDPPQQLPW